jgi:hypothetical protein
MAALIEVPLNSYRYHFRRLTWLEETRLSFSKIDDQRKVILAHAMVDISGMPVTPEEAMQVLKHIPDALFWRIWIVYRGNLPQERYYTSGGLYEAPDPMAYQQRIYDDGEAVEAVVDAATAKLESKFGKTGVEEAEDISRQMFRQAERAGTLVPAQGSPARG